MTGHPTAVSAGTLCRVLKCTKTNDCIVGCNVRAVCYVPGRLVAGRACRILNTYAAAGLGLEPARWPAPGHMKLQQHS
jgi:hypothetical protein